MSKPYNRGTKAKPNWWIKWARLGLPPSYAGIGPDYDLAKQVLLQKEREELARQHGVEIRERPAVPLFNAAADVWTTARSQLDVGGQPLIRSWRDDQSRLKLHLRPRFGRKLLNEITVDDVRAMIPALRKDCEPQTVRNILHTLSGIYESQPRAMQLENPVRALTRQDRKAIGKSWDPRKTPFLKTKGEVRRLYLAFPEMAADKPFRAMYAAGALSGPRPGETRALWWADFNWEARLIHVQRSDKGPTKDGESRFIPLVPALELVMKEWRAHVPLNEHRVFPPITERGPSERYHYLHEDTFNAALELALAEAGLPRELTYYQTGRHTFGAQWVINGGSLVKLAAVLGHSSTEVTKRYGHLVPGEFTEAERSLVDLSLEPTKVIPLKKA